MASRGEGKKELRGAIASNAGDDFHVLWTLKHALRLLDATSGLTAITVEGIPGPAAPSALDTSSADWEGVDVALFYGGDALESAQRVEIQQLKYSTASPDKAWTIARLCQTSNKAKDNSVIARLAEAFCAANARIGDRPSEAVLIKLVSNQPLSDEVPASLASTSSTKGGHAELRKKLRVASGLTEDNFESFVRALDFSECGGPTRFAVQQRVIEAISEIASSDVRPMMFELRHYIYRQMLPEGSSAPITRESVLSAFYVNDMLGLLPCPAQLEQPTQIVSRHGVRELASSLLMTNTRVCLHGDGGCGKTTALLELGGRLPPGSQLIIFDCYGGGSYLDSDGQRHLPQHALLHLCNELATRVGAPMLIVGASGSNYPREFMERLRKAASVVRAGEPNALLVLAIDAADNSVTAAASKTPQERSFVHDVLTLGELPENVRLVVTCRTGRLPDLHLPPSFLAFPLGDFTETETAEFVRMRQPALPILPAWIADLHKLSNGNARVIAYALKYGEETSQDPLVYLNPHGKDLERIFQERVAEALRRGGNIEKFRRMCGALIALPRPIPMPVLAELAEVSEAELIDAINDLVPGLRYVEKQVGFSDEDFEAFIRTHSTGTITETYRKASALFLREHEADSYCAEHVASMLFLAKDTQGLIRFVQTHPDPKVIKDPVHRREIHLHRLKLAMQVARAHGGVVEAVQVLLRGARALKTDAAMSKMLRDNVDLASAFATPSLRRAVLMQPTMVGLHGGTLSSLALQAARQNDSTSSRSWLRQFRGWLSIRDQHRKDRNAAQWKLDVKDLANEGEAALLVFGAEMGSSEIRRWAPKPIMPPVLLTIAQRLLTQGRIDLVRDLVSQTKPTFWSIFVYVPMAFSGQSIDANAVDRIIARWTRRQWVTPEKGWKELRAASQENASYRALLVASEIVASRGLLLQGARSLLTLLSSESWRRADELYAGHHRVIDSSLRGYALLELSEGREPTTDLFLLPDETPIKGADSKEIAAEKKRRVERFTRLTEHVKKLLPIYVARAKVLLAGPAGRDDRFQEFESLVSASAKSHGSQDSHEMQTMRQHLARTIAELIHVPSLDPERIAKLTLSFSRGGFSSEMRDAVACLALKRDTHSFILQKVIEAAEAAMQAREPATEVAANLLNMARMIALISPDDSAALFNHASEALSEIDYDSVHQIGMLESLSRRATVAMEAEERREAAARFVIVVSDTYSYLKDMDHFPWSAAIRGLTCLDPCLALAAISQWDDAGGVTIRSAIAPFLHEAARTNCLSFSSALVLVRLADELDDRIIGSVSDLLPCDGDVSIDIAIEELIGLATSKVDGLDGLDDLRRASELRRAVSESPTVKDALSLVRFHFSGQQLTELPSEHEETSALKAYVAPSEPEFITACEIEEYYRQWQDQQKLTGSYASPSEFFSGIKFGIRRPDRRAHLQALSEAQLGGHFPQFEALTRAALEWLPESPAVKAWCQQQLPILLRDRIEHAFRMRIDEDLFGQLLDACGLPNSEISDAILDGIESGVSQWDSGTVYGLLELLATYLSPEDSATVLSAHLRAEVERVDHAILDWRWHEVPIGIEEALGQMIYAFMGDIALARRWTAAHAFRAVARLGESRVLSAILGCWAQTSSNPFRAVGLPTYWLASRLWLSIGLARVANETPQALRPHADTIFEFSRDPTFPHILCRRFLIDAIAILHDIGGISAEKLHVAKRMNESDLSRRRKQSHRRNSGRHPAQKDRRFHFDSTDTIPYWYDPALRAFADVDMSEFLDAAEGWILDRWHGKSNVWMWDHEPRPHKLGNGLGSMHRHGSLPALERYSTHLEWHAMFCAVGELLLSRPLATTGDSEYGSFSSFLSGYLLSSPKSWLADLRQTKPLIPSQWFCEEQNDGAWLGEVTLSYLLQENGIVIANDQVIVASNTSGQQGDRRWSINVSTALVSSESAAALLRSLQGIRKWDYRIPDEGNDLELDAPDFRLKGWLRDTERDMGIDEDDPARRSVGRLAVVPGKDVSRRLALRYEAQIPRTWVDGSGASAMCYGAWSDNMENARYSRDFPRTEGYQLSISKAHLRQYLMECGMDLIMEVDGNRSTEEQEYGEDGTETKTRKEFDYVVVFRSDGTIQTADGSIGAW